MTSPSHGAQITEEARECPCCSKPITGHQNKRFCNSKCKDWHHNAQPHRIDRTRAAIGAKTPASGLLGMIDRKRGGIQVERDHDEERCPPDCECYSCVMDGVVEDDF